MLALVKILIIGILGGGPVIGRHCSDRHRVRDIGRSWDRSTFTSSPPGQRIDARTALFPIEHKQQEANHAKSDQSADDNAHFRRGPSDIGILWRWSSCNITIRSGRKIAGWNDRRSWVFPHVRFQNEEPLRVADPLGGIATFRWLGTDPASKMMKFPRMPSPAFCI